MRCNELSAPVAVWMASATVKEVDAAHSRVLVKYSEAKRLKTLEENAAIVAAAAEKKKAAAAAAASGAAGSSAVGVRDANGFLVPSTASKVLSDIVDTDMDTTTAVCSSDSGSNKISNSSSSGVDYSDSMLSSDDVVKKQLRDLNSQVGANQQQQVAASAQLLQHRLLGSDVVGDEGKYLVVFMLWKCLLLWFRMCIVIKLCSGTYSHCQPCVFMLRMLRL